jgi:threonine aldolase
LAKGRLLGLQFDTLFTDNLYFRISRHAIDAAMELQQLFRNKQIPLYIQSPTNQQFPILTPEQIKQLEGKVHYEIWERLSDGRAVTRFATSWATPMEHIRLLADVL